LPINPIAPPVDPDPLPAPDGVPPLVTPLWPIGNPPPAQTSGSETDPSAIGVLPINPIAPPVDPDPLPAPDGVPPLVTPLWPIGNPPPAETGSNP
ncbi:MAG: hypothetical protein ACRC33_05000, partial [Gemmataceae bacterium]